jgi:hypothetical protein
MYEWVCGAISSIRGFICGWFHSPTNPNFLAQFLYRDDRAAKTNKPSTNFHEWMGNSFIRGFIRGWLISTNPNFFAQFLYRDDRVVETF